MAKGKRKTICILGMHRAGTSLLTRILNISGMAIGEKEEIIGVRKGNPTGHWENKAFVEINNQIISIFKKNADWHEIPDYPTNWLKNPKVVSLERKAKELVKKMNARYKIWGWKDPRTCVTLPFWQKIIGDELVYVVIFRNPLDVAKSLKKVHNLPHDKSILLWARYYLTVLDSLRGKKFSFIHSEKLLSNWEKEIKKILKHINSSYLKINDQKREEVNNFIRPSIWHFSTKTKNSFFGLADNLRLALLDYLYLSTNKVKTILKKDLTNLGHQLANKTNQANALVGELTKKDEQLIVKDNQLSDFSKQLRDTTEELEVTKNELVEAEEKLGKTGKEIYDAIIKQEQKIKQLRLKAREINKSLKKKKMVIKEKNKKVADLSLHSQNLGKILANIVSAKTFKAWQTYVKIRRKPTLLIEAGKTLLKKGPGGLKQRLTNVQQKEERIAALNQQYHVWLRKNTPTKKELRGQKRKQKKFEYRPKISIITPVYNTDKKWLRACIESVLVQTYDNWELCIADDASTKPYIKKILKEYEKKDKRINVVYRRRNGHISRASNSALRQAVGKFIALLDHDDKLVPHALYRVVEFLNKKRKADFVYSDEDKLDLNGNRVKPFFKPDWSPDMFLSANYLCHLSVIRKKLVDKVGGFKPGYEGSQDYDLFLRITEKTDKIYHIPDVLYSWREASGSTAAVYEVKGYADAAAAKALKSSIKRKKLKAEVEQGLIPGTFRVKYKIKKKPLVSIIIPTKDIVNYLKRCVESILKKTDYDNYEIIIVDTGSKEKKTFRYYEKLKKNPRIKFLQWDKPFNFASVNNFAVKNTQGKYVLLLNNDIEVVSYDWIKSMLEHAQRAEVGAVGAKLLYPDGKIQHAGIILGIRGGPIKKGIAGHAQKMFIDEPSGLPLWNSKDMIRNFSAVTAACLMIERSKYLEVKGMNEKLEIAFNDVDFCLKLQKKGYLNVYTPYGGLYHYESVSVGRPSQGTRDIAEFQKEINIMHRKWGHLLQNDPYYNSNLTLDREDFSLGV